MLNHFRRWLARRNDGKDGVAIGPGAVAGKGGKGSPYGRGGNGGNAFVGGAGGKGGPAVRMTFGAHGFPCFTGMKHDRCPHCSTIAVAGIKGAITGSMNYYCTNGHAWSDDDRNIGSVVDADRAARLAQADIDRLRAALDTEETGVNLVAVARDAHAAELALAHAIRAAEQMEQTPEIIELLAIMRGEPK
jgi:hypothetical protein